MSNEQIRASDTSGLLQPLTVPNRKCESNSIYFIVHLPRTQKYFDNFFVVADGLTKATRFIPTTTILITLRVAKLFFSKIVMNYGLARGIICGRNRKFVSIFWKYFSNCVGPKLI
jgi:hypothetical protein